ncbi:ABC transporter ATP-binding protein [Gracilibacillus sp. HCP3S3_G5_1]|uniref:ABC transporter ATP-binding protein n=1 Tax=unclassified Gracilibacillus TaxID=2625209 RepID=UPI003F88C721
MILKNENISKVISTFKVWPKMYKFIWETNKLYFLFILTLTFVSGLIPAAMIYLLETLVDSLDNQSYKTFNIIFIFAISYIALIALSTILDSYLELIKGLFQESLLKKVNITIIDKASKIPYIYFEDNQIYDIIQRTRDESTYRPFQIFDQSLAIVKGFIIVISVANILIQWKWWIIILLLIIPFLSAVSFIKLGEQEYLINFFQASKRRVLYYLTHLITKDAHIKELKTFNRTSTIKNKYENHYKIVYNENKEIAVHRFKVSLTYDLLTISIVGLIVFFIIQQAYIGIISIGSVVAYIQAVNKTQSTSSGVIRQIFSLYENNLFINLLFDFYSLPEENEGEAKLNHPLSNNSKMLVMENVSFSYPSRNEFAVKNVSLSFKPGETVAIVGENGSGKSTLIKLLCNLYEPNNGTITYNNIPLQNYPINVWRDKLGVVFQEFNRYEFTAEENITLGGEYTETEIKQAACYSGADEFITSLNKNYKSQLGVQFLNGVQLSGGQWQKIAISRAFLKNADIFILDEPTASLDGLSQEKIFENFKTICQSKIGIFISHRLSNIKHADKIIVMNSGEIDDIGTHNELVVKKGLYFDLYQSQVSTKGIDEEYIIG